MILFLVSLLLTVCLEFQMVKQQFGTGYLLHTYGFYFDTSVKGEPSITVDFPRMSDEWMLTKEVTHRQVCLLRDMVPTIEVH